MEDTMRRAGLRVTRPRLLVYAALQERGGHQSADDVLGALRARGERLSRASVYNVLRDLGARGLARATDTGHGRAYYEAGPDSHPHFVCRACGLIADVHGPTPPPPPDSLPPGFHIAETQIIYRGYCPQCAPRNAGR